MLRLASPRDSQCSKYVITILNVFSYLRNTSVVNELNEVSMKSREQRGSGALPVSRVRNALLSAGTYPLID